jgi:transcription initiation factor TFIIB
MVLGDRIVDTRSECELAVLGCLVHGLIAGRTFAGDENGDDPSRVGDSSNPLLKETFDTQISSHDGGKGIARDLQRAANRQVHGPGNKSNALLSAAFSKLNEKAEMMQLPRAVVLQAQQIYSIGFEQNLIRGKDTDAAIGACLILGCRSAKVDRTLLEVANLVKVNKKKIGQALLALNPVVNKTRAGSGHLTTINNAEQQIQNIVARVVNYLGQPHEVQKAANHIAGAAADMEGVAGRSPVSIAAGILWFACLLYERDRADPPVTAKRISELAKVSDSTIKL